MQGFPVATRGQRIGLLGGSFDPAHGGHVHVTRAALARFGLDRVWWLVSPGNPLKPEGPAPMAARLAAARARVHGARVVVSDLEARIGTRRTAETLAWLVRHYPGVRFVWLMGADNLMQFHRWGAWREIAAGVPLGIVARPGATLAPVRAVAARVLAQARVPQAAARTLPGRRPPAWCHVSVPLHPASSSALRARGAWPTAGGKAGQGMSRKS